MVGGYAVAYYGYPRATNDLDIWIAMHPENAQRLVSVLTEFGFNTPNVTPDIFLKEHNVIRLGNPPIRIKILTTISGVEFNACYAERVVDTINGIPVNIISLPRLKENKRKSGRLKDLSDLEYLP